MEEQEAMSMTEEEEDEEEELDDEDWEASVRLANELQGATSSPIGGDLMDELADEMLQMEMNDLSAEEEDALGRAAREAVRKYEEEMAMKSQMKSKRKKAMSSPPPAAEEGLINGIEEEAPAEAAVDYSKMTVAQLKDVLRSKGLKVSGRKAELIERLEMS
mmetsp:Transcript_43653/g.91824  ORF Transcript_43653/g.91824 Transcript_43653/m.91824 type:complete len:161 (-) Transcript_43653:219-701(-)